jgi:DNA mismatch repair ATPase MutS
VYKRQGLGCYKKATINVYKYINSYLNIPDTSQRDSLFQAEARRCKEILDCLINNKNGKDRHFCIFDELYSGTNPSEAIASAYSFLNFISNYTNLNFLLTTHYISLCNLLEKNSNIVNKHMEIINNKNTYKLISGISNIKGGIKVLEDLNYNKTIIDGAKTIICEINL